MKDVFDYLEEEDLLRNLPEALPQMEDETAAKRIEKMALEKLQAETKQQKKWQKRRILIAAVCCLVAVGAFARKPIAAYFQRILHYLPGVGVYINDTDAEIYEVQIDNPVQEKDGVTYINPGSAALPKEDHPKSYMIYENGVFTIKTLTGDVILTHTL